MTSAGPEATQAKAGRIAGAMYLITIAPAVFNEFFVLRTTIIVGGDAAQTARNIVDHEQLFRIGLASELVGFTGIVVLTLVLYVLLEPVNKHLAMLGAFWRLVEAAVLCVATLGSSTALALLSGADHLKEFDAGQLQSLAWLALTARGHAYVTALIALGLGSTVFSYLLLRSGYIPRALAAAGIFSYLLVLTSALWFIVSPGTASALQFASYAVLFIYEVTLGSWLLLRGARPVP